MTNKVALIQISLRFECKNFMAYVTLKQLLNLLFDIKDHKYLKPPVKQ